VAVAAEREIAVSLAADRAHLVSRLASLPAVSVAAPPSSSFVLLRIPGADKVRLALREIGFAVRRGDTFPGLGPDFVRVAVRDQPTTDAFLAALRAVMTA
jgi:histidinol-phosphate aminotransferase